MGETRGGEVSMMINGFRSNLEPINKNYMQGIANQRKDSIIEGLQKQMQNLQEQLTKISDNEEMTIEQKIDRKKELREQIEELNRQMMQRNLEIRKEEQEKKNEKIEEAAKKSDKNVKNEDILDKNLISYSSSFNKIKDHKSIQTRLEGESRVLRGEIKMDEERGLDVSEKKKKLSELNSNIEKVAKDIGKELEGINTKIKETNKGENDKKALEKDATRGDKNIPKIYKPILGDQIEVKEQKEEDKKVDITL